jgi:WD40 repeat protein
VNDVAFSPDGTRILTSSDDRTARIWDTDGHELRVFRGHADRVHSGVFSPDGKHALTGAWDLTASLWRVDGTEVAVLRGHLGDVNAVDLSRDGSLAITGSDDGTARVWLLNAEQLLDLADTRLQREFSDAERERHRDLLDDSEK